MNKRNKTKIGHLDGRRLKTAVMVGAQAVIDRQEEINSINVYPFPDKDTGSNMAQTMKALLQAIEQLQLKEEIHENLSLHYVSDLFAESALKGSRGNSGAILAQFFIGLAEGFQHLEKAYPQDLVKAVIQGERKAREGVSQPVEGTILTVMKKWGDSLEKIVTQEHQESDFQSLFLFSLEVAKVALRETESELEILQNYQLVDAGALGFVTFLEGIAALLKNKEWRRPQLHLLSGLNFATGVGENQHVHEHHDFQEGAYTFCLECFVSEGESGPLEVVKIRENLKKHGDSLIVAGGKKEIKIHIHTDDPPHIFEMLRAQGKVNSEKVDNMRQQAKDFQMSQQRKLRKTVALITDSACDLPDDLRFQYNIHTVPVRLNFGEQEFIDKVTLDNKRFYKMLKTSPLTPKTSRPSLYDFKSCYQQVMKFYDGAISIHVPHKLSGTFQGAKQMAAEVSPAIIPIDPRSASCGLGLLAIEAGKAIEKGLTIDEVIKVIEEARERLEAYFYLDTIEYLIRGGRIPKLVGLLGKWLALRPVLTVNKLGQLKPYKSVFRRSRILEVLMELIKKNAEGKKNLRFGIGHGEALQQATELKQMIERQYPGSSIFIAEISPALGAHGGPGCIGVAMLSD